MHPSILTPPGLSRRNAMLAIAGFAAASNTAAQDFPSRPVRMFNPFPPGGVADSVARLVAERMRGTLGQPVIVDNRPGGSTFVAARAALQAPPDGYSMLFAAAASTLAELLSTNAGFSYAADFVPVAGLGKVTHLLVARESLPVKDVRELIQYAKANPGRLNYASTGAGTSTHVEMELFMRMSGTSMTHIPYKGSGPALQGLLAGDVDLMFDAIGSSMPHVKTGRLKALGVGSAEPSPMAPGIPPIALSGVPGFDVLLWAGLLVRTGTPEVAVDRINDAVNRVLSMPDMSSLFALQGFEVMPGSQKEFQDFYNRDRAQWTEVVRSANIKVE